MLNMAGPLRFELETPVAPQTEAINTRVAQIH